VKSKVEIELFEEHDKVNFYTIRVQNEETEIDKFFECFPEGCEYDEDIDIIIKWIDEIAERGALERYLRPEGKINDNVWAIPIETASLRLYVLRITDEIIILGNGGIKKTETYNEDEHLRECVELLQKIDGCLRSRVRVGKVTIYRKQLFGSLTFHIEED